MLRSIGEAFSSRARTRRQSAPSSSPPSYRLTHLVRPRARVQEIHTKIMSLAFEDCKVYISNVDSQSSAEGGIIVQVIGEMSNSNGPWRKFAQTFFLAEQPNGYFVLNDICRYIKEEGDDEPSSSSPAAPAQESAAASSVEHAVSTNDSAADADAAPASVGSVLFSDSKPAQAEQEKDDSASKAAAPAEPEPSEQPSEPNGKLVNGDVEMKSVEQDATVEVKEEQPEPIAVEPLSAVEHKSNESSAPTVKEETEIPAPVVEEVKKAEKEEVQEAKPTPAVESAPAASEPVSQAAAPAVAQPVASPAPAPAASPAAPAAPKSWASLAASNSTKWGSFNKAAAASTQVSFDSSLRRVTYRCSIRSYLRNPSRLPPRQLPRLLRPNLRHRRRRRRLNSTSKFRLSATRTASSRAFSSTSRRSSCAKS